MLQLHEKQRRCRIITLELEQLAHQSHDADEMVMLVMAAASRFFHVCCSRIKHTHSAMNSQLTGRMAEF